MWEENQKVENKSLLVEKFKYQQFKRKNLDGQRYYVNADGDPVPSVTSILSKTKDMTALNAWKKRVGAAEAQRIVTESANLGTIMHKHLECYIEGVERPSGTNQVYVQAKNLSETVIEHGLKNVDEVWGIETHLSFPGLYGGTADLICVHEVVDGVISNTSVPVTLKNNKPAVLVLMPKSLLITDCAFVKGFT